MDRRESLHGNLDACIKSALPLPLIKECQYLALTPIPHLYFVDRYVKTISTMHSTNGLKAISMCKRVFNGGFGFR
jgi:hypothetical protein